MFFPVCMCVHIYIYTHTEVCKYTHPHICIHCMYLCMCIYICIFAHMLLRKVYVYMYLYTCSFQMRGIILEPAPFAIQGLRSGTSALAPGHSMVPPSAPRRPLWGLAGPMGGGGHSLGPSNSPPYTHPQPKQGPNKLRPTD